MIYRKSPTVGASGMNTPQDNKDRPRRRAQAKPGRVNPGTGNIEPQPERKPRTSGGGEVLKTRQELAGALGYSVRTVDRLTAARLIPTIRTGRLVRYRLDAVLQALEKNATVKEVEA